MCVGVVLHVDEPQAYPALLLHPPPKKKSGERSYVCTLSATIAATSWPVILVHPLQFASSFSFSSSTVCSADNQLVPNLMVAARVDYSCA